MRTHPLAEVFGFPAGNMSQEATRYRKLRLCPYNNKVPNCTKDKANDPLGVCSIYDDDNVVITCPIRFRQDWLIAEDAAAFFFPPGATWTSLAEVRLNDKYGKTAGNIDIVLVSYDKRGRILDYGALEVQGVYISGNVRRPFEHYMADPARNAQMDWRQQPNYPRPDYLSSRGKLTARQAIMKGGVLDALGNRTAVALSKAFFHNLPALQEVDKGEADTAWLIYDVRPPTAGGHRYELSQERIVYTSRPTALVGTELPRGEAPETFLLRVASALEEVVV